MGDAKEASFHGSVADDVSFLQSTAGSSFWRKPLVRGILIFLSCVLLLLLSGQFVFHERDRLAANHPELKPWLLFLCAPMNCTVSPLKQIESVVIDSASFAKVRGDAYRFNLTAKNTASIALAVPSIELTLTDLRDQPVLRRVFLPSELGAKQDTLAPGDEWPVSLVVVVKGTGTAERIAGYHLLAFYP
jgi:hypothetical protein